MSLALRSLSIVSLFFLSIGCATAPKSAAGKAEITDEARQSIAKAELSDSTFGGVLHGAYGYAVFPTVGKGGLGFGGAYGKGVLFRGGVAIGYCDLTQVSIGFQFGGQSYTEVIVFKKKDPFESFKSGNFAFSAQATAVALKSGVGANAEYTGGVAVFTMDQAGLMYEASIGGQKFSFQPR